MPTRPSAHIVCVVAARPNLMKMAPILAALRRLVPAPAITLVHTGQHYDSAMNQRQFAALGLEAPDLNLEVGSASHAVQTADVMKRFETVLESRRPTAVLVVGDVNSTLACALVAAKMAIPVIHVEAGLRSFDRAMPEEINRILTDQLSDLLFTSEAGAQENLLREGIRQDAIHFAGNVMIDTLHQQLPCAVAPEQSLRRHGLSLESCAAAPGYAVLTLHRPSNVDDAERLAGLLHAVASLSRSLPVLFPVHPRTGAALDQPGLRDLLRQPGIVPLPPLDYLEMLGLMQHATLVLTDSGGIQEETTALGVPCLTLRANTERPVTVSQGTNTVAGHDPAVILALCDDILVNGGKRGKVPPLWDGHAADRIAATIAAWLRGRGA
ncbi:non-hydrolyzing UDP-N-acetylglucosamine 2-epimerase [Janthinobacterium agaricidamnosum]|uniref:UDP-N-acetylglucosamine 2-epimerase n=1 Tax=Janthinobacterium agaricidamnosum NBRC 102515 = DSM 9628 TaxID=1349767 RepID=W0V7D5_9BURK|nr:UDP-N-acetylglucosamine 2-epimerase (non-hydrolyzing) [Janthinobacterium agaricidamnosum]CDG83268.1 UDP-N-acetylglucosamine 2-epimerase [Janthinobacterium agaricidamnosum NBRC 102515 = DSM 9628]